MKLRRRGPSALVVSDEQALPHAHRRADPHASPADKRRPGARRVPTWAYEYEYSTGTGYRMSMDAGPMRFQISGATARVVQPAGAR
jgi:hypothetical protein